MKSEELKKAREQQVLDRRKCQAIEIQREKEETERIARVNQESLEREKQEDQRRRCVSFVLANHCVFLDLTLSTVELSMFSI